MSGQDWNTILNRVHALQAAEADHSRSVERVRNAQIALNEAINRDGSLDFESSDISVLQFVVDGCEYTVIVPFAMRQPATVTTRLLNVITLNK